MNKGWLAANIRRMHLYLFRALVSVEEAAWWGWRWYTLGLGIGIGLITIKIVINILEK